MKSLRVLATSALLALTPSSVHAEDAPKQEELPKRQANFAWEKQEKAGSMLLRASFSFRDVVDKSITDKLLSGLPVVIAVRAYVVKEGASDPIALGVRQCRVVYDLWDEVYRLKISGPTGEENKAALKLDGVLRQCAEARDLAVADKTLLELDKPYFLGVIVEVNPISPQMLDQMRKWVSRPAGSTGIQPGDALFGSFVSLFVRQIGTADKTLRFRTQSVTPTAP